MLNPFSNQAQMPKPLLHASAERFSVLHAKMHLAHENHLGYPYNLSFTPGVPPELGQYPINNLGDPYAGSHYGAEVRVEERVAIAWLMRLWGCHDLTDYWGSVGARGTEGNLWGIYLGREMLPRAVMLYGDDAHYSLPKAARILRIPAVPVKSQPNGEMDMGDFALQLALLQGKPVIVALTCGTTMKGAHDDIGGVLRALVAAGYDQNSRYVHIDGALNAMVLPFLHQAPTDIQPSFASGIDSISTSGHKMIGTPMPCGALVCRKRHADRIAQAIAYLRSNDTTLMGSRNGHAVLAIWARLTGHGYGGFAHDALRCTQRAQKLAATLRDLGADVLCNPHSLTVVFPMPSEPIIKTYQLACHAGQAHAIIMPNVTEALLARFVGDYADWWAGQL